MDPKEEFRVYMRAASRGLEDGSALHISDEDLIAYQHARLGGPERNRIQHHFLLCSSCLDRLKDVSDFFGAAQSDEESPNEAMIAREWEAFRRQLPPRENRSVIEARQRFRSSVFAPRILALAAMVLIILTTGWGLWLLNKRDQRAREFEREQSVLTERMKQLDEENRRLREQYDENLKKEARLNELEKENQKLQQQTRIYESLIAELKQPELNSPIYDIYEESSTQRSTGSDPKNSVFIARKSKMVTLILNGADQPEHRDYVIEMVDQKGRVIWKKDGLKRDSLGNFVVTLYRASLGVGKVVLKVYGRSGNRSDLIGQYNVSVRLQD